jgi:alpha-tubulin suppressor-like RCC1 family protein
MKKKGMLIVVLMFLAQVAHAADTSPPDTFFTQTPVSPSNATTANFGFSGIDATTAELFRQISGAYTFSLAIKNGDGSVWAWGANYVGQLGDGSTTQRGTPGPVTGLSNARAVSGGENHGAALLNDSTVWTWGFDYFGQLGDGNTEFRTTPVQVLNNTKQVAASERNTYALKNDGTVWAWGFNFNGEVGDNTSNERHTPVRVVGLTNVSAVYSKKDFALALKPDGTVWAWGTNSIGQLGDETTTARFEPVQVHNLANVSAISGGAVHSLVLKTDGTVWTWGLNSHGQLGDGTLTNRATPVQVPGLSNIVQVAGGWIHSLALKPDGTVWSWGMNSDGQLGDNTTTDRNSPVQVLGLDNVVAIAAGGYQSMALKSDGSVWVWGDNENGQIGDNTLTDRLTPVQILQLGGLSFEDSLDGNFYASAVSPRTLTGLSEGVHTYRVRAIDSAGNIDPTPANYTWIIDVTPPAITNIALNPAILWPPNHRMVTVSVGVNAGSCDLSSSCAIIAVNSSEPVNGQGDGDTSPDWNITGDLTVQLRAERSGSGPGRNYTLRIRCTDAAGNSAFANAIVNVPHDKS